MKKSMAVILAAVTAVGEVRRRIEEYPDAFDLILWVLFDEKTKRAYDAALMGRNRATENQP